MSNPTPLLEAVKALREHMDITRSHGLRLPTIASYLCSCRPVNPRGSHGNPKSTWLSTLCNPSSFTSQFAPSLHDLDVHNRSFFAAMFIRDVCLLRFCNFKNGGHDGHFLSRFSVLQFAPRCCSGIAVIRYPSGFKFCSHRCTQAKLH